MSNFKVKLDGFNIDMRTSFTRDICKHPEDDTPRLIFADWLEDHGEPERAEFIRVQCELAKPHDKVKPSAVIRRGYLVNREDQLWNAHRIGYTFDGYGLQSRLGWERCEGEPNICIVRRGFISRISLTLDDFMGALCKQCGGGGEGSFKYGHYQGSKCTLCLGTGHVGGHAKALFREHPITEVRLTDRKPYVSGFSGLGVATWYDACGERGGIDPSSSDLPTNLFLALSGEDRFNEGNGIKYYDSLDPALAAISLACVTYGRKLVGLPPL